jgi:hypothetical protein
MTISETPAVILSETKNPEKKKPDISFGSWRNFDDDDDNDGDTPKFNDGIKGEWDKYLKEK